MLLFLISSFEIKALDQEHFDAVDLVETAFNKLAENVVSIDCILFHTVGIEGVYFSTCTIQETVLILKPCSFQYEEYLLTKFSFSFTCERTLQISGQKIVMYESCAHRV